MKIKKILYGDNDYGFFTDINNKEIKKINTADIKYYSWLTTGRFNNANNHCAATTSTNLDIFFTKINYFSDEDIFDEHHKLIGNGPVLWFANKTKKILKNKHIKLKNKTHFFNKINHIKENIDKGNISTLLLSEALFNWHWVICVGYVEMTNNETILIIVDNWHNTTRYYRPNIGSRFISTTSYFVAWNNLITLQINKILLKF